MSATKKPTKAQLLARVVVASILDGGLCNSTWRDQNSAAYEELLKYREDMIHDVEKVLKASKV